MERRVTLNEADEVLETQAWTGAIPQERNEEFLRRVLKTDRELRAVDSSARLHSTGLKAARILSVAAIPCAAVEGSWLTEGPAKCVSIVVVMFECETIGKRDLIVVQTDRC